MVNIAKLARDAMALLEELPRIRKLLEQLLQQQKENAR